VTATSVVRGGQSADGVVGPVAHRRGDYWIVRSPWTSAAARDRLVTARLDEVERAELAALTGRAQNDRALGRIAAKDAVRHWLAERGAGWRKHRDIRIYNDAVGRPHALVDGVVGVEAPGVSLAHCRGTAVVAVSAPVAAVGVDIEVIEARGTVFARLALTDAELRMGDRLAFDEWVTRAWTVKEAVAKAAGSGLRGRPKDFVLHELDGDWVLASGRWVRSTREGDMVVSIVGQR
jgi:phosphopantetheinyl transferase